MKFGSVCSGIEAASVAWEPLGWEAQWFSEIEQFPSAVLAHRFPSVPNLGDMTKIHETQIFQDATIDLLVGGTPCQSFSVAGLRKGLADPRGNLMLTFLALAQRKKPRWIVWENVPGVLSSNGGRDFGTFLQALAECGYGFAYRVLDAQYFGVAQRRRRVFVVGYLGDWRPAGAVLFEQDCLSGNTKKSREKRKATATDAQGGSGGRGQSTGVNPDLMATLCAKDNEKWGCNQWVNEGKAIVEPKASWWNGEQTAATLTKQNSNGAQRMPDKDNLGAVLQPVAHAFKVRGGSEVETGEQGGTPGKKAGKGYLGSDELAFTIGTTQDEQVAQPIPIHDQATRHSGKRGEHQDGKGNGMGIGNPGDPMNTLTKGDHHAVAQPIPFRKSRRCTNIDDYETWVEGKIANTINTFENTDIRATNAVVQPIAVDVYNQSISGDKVGIVREQHGTNMNAILHPIAVDTYNQTTSNINQTIKSPQGGLNESIGVVVQPIAVDCYNQTINEHTTQTIGSSASDVNHYGAVLQPTMAIRRLTPTETERLQGFPDGWTKIPYRNKPADQCPDGPRYKACGNSMAVPVMRWIGQRIEMVEQLMKEQK